MRKEFKSVAFTPIRREENAVANKLAVDGRKKINK